MAKTKQIIQFGAYDEENILRKTLVDKLSQKVSELLAEKDRPVVTSITTYSNDYYLSCPNENLNDTSYHRSVFFSQ